MKIIPFDYERVGDICEASSPQFLYQEVGDLKKFTFFGKVSSRRLIRTVVKERSRYS